MVIKNRIKPQSVRTKGEFLTRCDMCHEKVPNIVVWFDPVNPPHDEFLCADCFEKRHGCQ